MYKGQIPVVILLIPFLLGLAAGMQLMSDIYLPALAITFICLAIVFITLNLNYQRLVIYKVRWIGGLLMGVILFSAGWISVISYNELNNRHHFSKIQSQYLAVNISNEPQFKNGLVRFTASVHQSINQRQTADANGTLLLALKDSDAIALQYGDELLVPANYTPIDPPFNPAEFNYKKYLAHQNIYYQVFLFPGQYKLLKHDTGNPFIAYALKLRQQMVVLFRQKLHDPNAIAVASTLILGYKADLSNDILQAYSKTGTIHVLSVSGAHVAIIYLLMQWMLSFLNRYKYGRLLKMTIMILLISYYAMLTGFSPAVCRAAVMISMVIIGNTFVRHISMLNILAISALLLLLYDPFFITDVGFQLSYLSVVGLIVLQPVVYEWFKFKNKWADKLWALCSVSIAAQVITFPLSAYYFHQFPVYFLLSNLLIIIPTMIIMYSGIAYLLLAWVPWLSTVLAWVLEKSILFMNKALSIIEHAPFASINKIWFTTAEYLLTYALIISLFYFLYDKKSWLLKFSIGCMFLLCVSISIKTYRADNSSSVAFLNLRKNTGIVFKNGDRAVVITNLTDTDKNYKYSIQPYLDSCKISHVELFTLNQGISKNFIRKQGGLIQFNHQKILVFDKQMLNLQLPEKLKTDYLYITGNPYADLDLINKNYDYQTLVIDGSNSTRLIDQLEQQAKKKRINYSILKRNISLIAVSN
ncbi:competence protein ComEC [Mucilaginibacter lappiensis]|uniref:Competence protein ComEC n=1 Tax=Mucilaginibacter lappiensis TaxID=354630 RepID=A0ABR6PIN5_9SPHI|nr:ComEC/Rec2 family competence protein [Mucilaginibacter lappiensis]MBB6109628.1 competence protein ComEC [Mucilaginibacter lappiensis]SIR09925.1 competence protein ComEC [Mucilaginibacter lappiensis]